MSRVKDFTVLFMALVLVLVSIPAFAQSGTGVLTGQVTDQSGAVVPGGTVTVTNQATNEGHVVQSDTTGFYRVVSLQPGKYSVKASAQGFKTSEQSNIEV